MLTTWPLPSLQHFANGPLGQREESGEIDSDHRCIVVSGVIGERLGDEHAGIVDERVDAAEAPEAPLMIRSVVAASEMSPSTVRRPGHRRA